MSSAEELALVGIIATVCTFTIAFWLAHIDRLWGRWEQERRALADGKSIPNAGFFRQLGGIARQSQFVILFGGGILLLSLAWLFWQVIGLPAVPIRAAGFLGFLTIAFVGLAVRIWWREFEMFRTAMEKDERLFSRPQITFHRKDHLNAPGGALIVVAVQQGPLSWADLQVIPEGCLLPTGEVQAGDTIEFSRDGPFELRGRDGHLYYTVHFHV